MPDAQRRPIAAEVPIGRCARCGHGAVILAPKDPENYALRVCWECDQALQKDWLAEHDAQVLRDAAANGRRFLGDECLGESAWLYITDIAEDIATGGGS